MKWTAFVLNAQHEPQGGNEEEFCHALPFSLRSQHKNCNLLERPIPLHLYSPLSEKEPLPTSQINLVSVT
jgi:hypothetical protein